MTKEHTSFEWQRIRELAHEYTSKGYSVAYPRNKFDLPDFLQNEEYMPDLILRSGEENLIVEVKTSQSVRHEKHLSRISEIVNRHPGWQFLFVLTNVKSEVSEATPPSGARWQELLQQSRHPALEAAELWEAAFVLAWAALEGAIRESAVEAARNGERKPVMAKSPMSQIRDAAILGLVDRRDIPKLENLFSIRNGIVHAANGVRPSLADVRTLQNLVDEIIQTARTNEP